MKYDHLVKHNGVYYMAGEDVPDSSPVFDKEKPATEIVETAETAEIAEEQAVTEAPQYSKSDISRMNVADLKKLAPTLGIAVTEESTGAQLKREIIAKLGL